MLSPGTRLGPYTIVSAIGAGGMGEVYRAHDPRLSRDIALKVLARVGDSELRRRFESEARAASALTHPNIVVVHDIGDEGGMPYIAMELVEGQTLRATMGSAQPLERLLAIAIQIADALRTAHARGVAHRDLKPENVLVTPSSVVKVVDFGLAKVQAVDTDHTAAATQTGLILGTPGYMSPEQARGLPSDARSDQFAFGALLYELATGRRAFHKPSAIETAAATLGDEPTPVSSLRPDLPAPLAWILQRCLAKDPAARYDTTDHLYSELVALRHLLTNPRPAAAMAAQQDSGGVIGRSGEADRIIGMLQQPDVNWLTLTGAGGVGKTSLARLVASRASQLFGDSIVNVALSTVSDAALVVTAVAEAVGAQPRNNESPAEAVARWLRERQQPVLLILDNFEHVAVAAPEVARLVRGLPGVKILATSRAVLHVSHEHEFVVEGLDPESALLLFVARAQAARPEFKPGESESADIAALCEKLGRLPLAIELAAARVKVMPPKLLHGRLEGRLLSLTGGALDRPERHQTLRATVEWSFGLLTAEEQRLFRRLGVFAGGCTLDAVEAVCDARQDLGIEIIDGIASLVDNSLITRVASQTPNAEPRFTMLEILREYAIERLEAAGEFELFRRAQAAYCLVLCEESAGSRDLDAQQQWLTQCDAELANIRAACAHLLEAGSTEWALRIANSLLPFWEARGLFVEAEAYVRRAIAMPDAEQHPALRAQCLLDLLSITHVRGDYTTAVAVANRTIAAFEQVGDMHGVAAAHNAVGIVYRDAGKYDDARRAMSEAARLWREHRQIGAAARAVSNLASTELRAGRYHEARRLYAECREMFSLIADEAGVRWSLQHEGDAAREAGDREDAQRLYADAYARFSSAGDNWGISAAQTALGDVALDDGDTARASALFTDALATTRAIGSRRGVARLLDAFARTAAASAQHARALRLAGAANALRQQLGVHLPDNERRALDRALSEARQNEGAAAAYLAGSAMSADQAVAYATSPTA